MTATSWESLGTNLNCSEADRGGSQPLLDHLVGTGK